MNDVFDAPTFLSTLTEQPGVYRMLDAKAVVLYVGKAKNLKKRVSSYFRQNLSSPRIALMVAQIAAIETTITHSEDDALLLENNLIKSLAPRYNILFRDDKSYPYITLTRDEYPRIGFYRGNTDRKADYFGPFPSSSAVRESIALLQRMFRLRTCENSVFKNRSRPCLLYQIKRCSGSCVELIRPEAYAQDVKMASLFLQGREQEVLAWLAESMDKAAALLNFEEAVIFRDQMQSLRQIQGKQYVESAKGEDVDIVVAVTEDGVTCVNLAMVRGGRHLGDKPQFPVNARESSEADVLAAFIDQHYQVHPVPERIYLKLKPDEEALPSVLAEWLDRPLPIFAAKQHLQKKWVEMAEGNASLAIRSRHNRLSRQIFRLQALCEALSLEVGAGDEFAEVRIECFDISHTQGEATVASCVVYEGQEMKKSDYRRFNIKNIQAGDDYAAIRQVVFRRYEKLADGQIPTPTLILIDGGKGQLSVAYSALAELGLAYLPMIGVAKGEGRKPGLETLMFTDGREPLQLPAGHPALHLIQEIRDEAHRFAITGHRAKRSKSRQTSQLNEIPGIGPKRRKALIAHFGGLQGVSDAGIDQLTRVPGISRDLAETIYAALH